MPWSLDTGSPDERTPSKYLGKSSDGSMRRATLERLTSFSLHVVKLVIIGKSIRMIDFSVHPMLDGTLDARQPFNSLR